MEFFFVTILLSIFSLFFLVIKGAETYCLVLAVDLFIGAASVFNIFLYLPKEVLV